MNLRVSSLAIVRLPAACLLVSSCESPRHPPRASGDARAERPIAMRGEATFFDGTLRVESTVSRGVPRRSGEGARAGAAGSAGRRSHGGHRGMGGGSPGADEGEPRDSESTGRIGLPQLSAPSLTLRLKLENTSAQPVDVQIRDVISDLGSFAVRPEHLQLAPAQFGEVDPMVSELGVVAAEIPVTVVLSVGGKTESHVVVVKDIHASAPPPATAP